MNWLGEEENDMYDVIRSKDVVPPEGVDNDIIHSNRYYAAILSVKNSCVRSNRVSICDGY